MFAIGRDGGHEKIPKVSSLCHSGGGEAPKNVIKKRMFSTEPNNLTIRTPLSLAIQQIMSTSAAYAPGKEDCSLYYVREVKVNCIYSKRIILHFMVRLL